SMSIFSSTNSVFLFQSHPTPFVSLSLKKIEMSSVSSFVERSNGVFLASFFFSHSCRSYESTNTALTIDRFRF
ncbi:hypothetical protein PMAYCL1PPCAC_12713, partial [Pristionchus mayeri]